MAFVSLQTSARHSNASSSRGDSRTEFETGPEHWDATKAVQLASWGTGGAKSADTHALSKDENPAGSLSFTAKGQAVQATEMVDGPLRWSRTLPATSLHALQEWEGYVIEIGEADFTARLLDITAGASIEGEEADIPLSEISEADAARMKIGSIFRWVIGYERSTRNLSIKRISQIVFRELPAITRSDEQAGLAWAEKITSVFDR